MNTFRSFLILLLVFLFSAFTFVPLAHKIPEINRFIPAMVYELPPTASLTFVLDNKSVKTGEELCVELKAEGFEQILSMQYSAHWDANVLKFKEIRNLNLPGLTKSNFGENIATNGTLTFSWYDPKFTGASIEQDKPIFMLCFDAVGKTGATTTISFDGKPTPIEIADTRGNFMELKTRGGKISIQ
jgi:hypothetical protein